MGSTVMKRICIMTMAVVIVVIGAWQAPVQALAATCGYPNGPKTGTMMADVNEYKIPSCIGCAGSALRTARDCPNKRPIHGDDARHCRKDESTVNL